MRMVSFSGVFSIPVSFKDIGFKSTKLVGVLHFLDVQMAVK